MTVRVELAQAKYTAVQVARPVENDDDDSVEIILDHPGNYVIAFSYDEVFAIEGTLDELKVIADRIVAAVDAARAEAEPG